MIRYLAGAVVLVEAVALVVLLAPLPGGYRQKFIDVMIKRMLLTHSLSLFPLHLTAVS